MDDKEIRVTCFITTYMNYERIYNAIDSILNQNYSNIEIAVFDDGTPEFPEDVLMKYIEDNKKDNIRGVIVSHSSINRGTVKNLNRMIKATSGDILVGIGQDDLLNDSGVIEDAVDFYKKNKPLLFASKYQVVDKNGDMSRIGPRSKNIKKWQECTANEQFKWIAIGAPIAGPGLFFTREVLTKFNNFDERYCLQEDGPFLLRVTREGIHIAFFDRITMKYQLGQGVSSGDYLHPKLIEDISRMFTEEIDPYLSQMNYFEKRAIKYEKERIRFEKKIGYKAILLFIKYPDVMLARKLFAR